jgi:hypothetical protein
MIAAAFIGARVFEISEIPVQGKIEMLADHQAILDKGQQPKERAVTYPHNSRHVIPERITICR